MGYILCREPQIKAALRRLLLLLLVSANQALGGGVQPLPSLPAATTAYAVQVDISGNIYVAGEFLSNPRDPNAPAHAFIGKLSPNGSQVIWWTVLAGIEAR